MQARLLHAQGHVEVIKEKKALCLHLGFTMSGAPKNWRVEVHGVQPAMFASLADRPTDGTLRSFVKAGAFYSVDVSATKLYGSAADLVRFFNREGLVLVLGSMTASHSNSSHQIQRLPLLAVARYTCDGPVRMNDNDVELQHLQW